MRTVKQVAELTGISIRTLQYYDEIGVFKPTEVTASGYRLYDEEALKTLQQILFFKELDFQLKDIKEIMENPSFDKIEAFKKQKKLIKTKRDRLDALLGLLEKLEKGEKCVSFKEFDMSEYLSALEQFKEGNTEDVVKYWGSVEKFNNFINKVKDDESKVAKLAIKQYGSIEKYTKAMKYNLSHFSEIMEQLDGLKDKAGDYVEKNKALFVKLTSDMKRDVKSSEIQHIVQEIMTLGEEYSPKLDLDEGEHYWDMIIDYYLHKASFIETNDKMYGSGSSEYIGHALDYYFNK